MLLCCGSDLAHKPKQASSGTLARLGSAENGAAFPATKPNHQPLLGDLNDSESLVEGPGSGNADYHFLAAKCPLARVFRALMQPRAEHSAAILDREGHLFKVGRARNIDPAARKKALLRALPRLTRAGAPEKQHQGGGAPEGEAQGTRARCCRATKRLPSLAVGNTVAHSHSVITPGRRAFGLPHGYFTVASNVPATKLLLPSSRHR